MVIRRRPSRVNIVAQGLSTPSLSPTHLSIRRGHATTTHYTHHQVSLVVSRNTTLVPSLGLRIWPALKQASALACEGSLCHPKYERKKNTADNEVLHTIGFIGINLQLWIIHNKISTNYRMWMSTCANYSTGCAQKGFLSRYLAHTRIQLISERPYV